LNFPSIMVLNPILAMPGLRMRKEQMNSLLAT
jgi:hypothetical protein